MRSSCALVATFDHSLVRNCPPETHTPFYPKLPCPATSDANVGIGDGQINQHMHTRQRPPIWKPAPKRGPEVGREIGPRRRPRQQSEDAVGVPFSRPENGTQFGCEISTCVVRQARRAKCPARKRQRASSELPNWRTLRSGPRPRFQGVARHLDSAGWSLGLDLLRCQERRTLSHSGGSQ